MKIGAYIALKEQLHGEYREKFDFVEFYGERHQIPQEVMAEKMMDLLDLFLEAQKQTAPPEQILGKNPETFCRNFFSDFAAKEFLRHALKRLSTFCLIIFVLEFIWLFPAIGTEGFTFLSYQTNAAVYLIGLGAGWLSSILFDLFGVLLVKHKKYSDKFRGMVATGCVVIAMAVAGVLGATTESVSIPGAILLLGCGGYLGVYYAVTLILRFRATGSIRKPENEFMTSFSGSVLTLISSNDCSKDPKTVKAFASAYCKDNSKRTRKGLPAFRTEEQFEYRRKKVRLASFVGVFTVLAYVVLIHLLFPDPSDSMTLPVLLTIVALVFYIWFRLMRFIERVSAIQQKSVLAACRKYEVEVDEYYAKLVREELEESSDSDRQDP